MTPTETTELARDAMASFAAPSGYAHWSAGLRRAHALWVGKRVRFNLRKMDGRLSGEIVTGTVSGVGDNGAQSECDGRRKWRFTGRPFVRLDDGRHAETDHTEVNSVHNDRISDPAKRRVD